MENEFSLICMTDKQFFFYLFNRRSYAGDLELGCFFVFFLKRRQGGGKGRQGGKSISRERVGVRALGDVCGSKADPLGLLAFRSEFVIPAWATFPPLSFGTQGEGERERAVFPAVFSQPPPPPV